MKLGSLFSGIGGLDLALEALGYDVAWHSENDKAASEVLARHWDVPNHGDVTTIDWDAVESVDALAAGYPCPPFSSAGKGLGESDDRYLWPEVARAVRDLRPRHVYLENVAAVLRFREGARRACDDLAALGYDVRWTCLRASDVGAPHRRDRWFAHAARDEGWLIDRDAGALAHSNGTRQQRTQPAERRFVPYGSAPAHPDVGRLQEQRERDSGAEGGLEPPRRHDANGRDEVAPHAERDRREVHPFVQEQGRGEPSRRLGSGVEWGAYEPAIRRWERTLGRPAPDPLQDGKLSPPFVEWMMGLPGGWVDGLSRTAALRCLGNAVVPQQAFAAFSQLVRLASRELVGEAAK